MARFTNGHRRLPLDDNGLTVAEQATIVSMRSGTFQAVTRASGLKIQAALDAGTPAAVYADRFDGGDPPQVLISIANVEAITVPAPSTAFVEQSTSVQMWADLTAPIDEPPPAT